MPVAPSYSDLCTPLFVLEIELSAVPRVFASHTVLTVTVNFRIPCEQASLEACKSPPAKWAVGAGFA